MEERVSYWMMMELNGLSHIYERTISDCFYSVCHKYGVEKEEQENIKEVCVEKVTKALKFLYS